MSYVTVGRENTDAIRIYYEDHGRASGVLVHGYLLDGIRGRSRKRPCWPPVPGYHLLRRGFGASSRPSVGYDYDTLAADLAVLLTSLTCAGWYWLVFARGPGR